eukprot:11217938-Lingulodinium_polyedra.AAC.1
MMRSRSAAIAVARGPEAHHQTHRKIYRSELARTDRRQQTDTNRKTITVRPQTLTDRRAQTDANSPTLTG